MPTSLVVSSSGGRGLIVVLGGNSGNNLVGVDAIKDKIKDVVDKIKKVLETEGSIHEVITDSIHVIEPDAHHHKDGHKPTDAYEDK